MGTAFFTLEILTFFYFS